MAQVLQQPASRAVAVRASSKRSESTVKFGFVYLALSDRRRRFHVALFVDIS